MQYNYQTRGVCARMISFEIEDDKVRNVYFNGGCNGNTQGVSLLVEGMPVDEVIRRLKGVNCRGRGTSCPDQLAKALTAAKEQAAARA